MGSTPKYAFPYPELTDSANVPRDTKALAEAVELSIGLFIVDSGWLACTVTAAGWTQLAALQVRRLGRACYVRGRLANATFTNPGHVALATMPTAVGVPAQACVFPVAATGATVYNRSFQIDSSGLIGVQSSVASSNYYDFTGSWVVSDGSP